MSSSLLTYLVQIITVILLVTVIFIEQRELIFLKNNTVQLLIACIVVIILLSVDALAGLILAIAMFIAYYKIYKHKIFVQRRTDEAYIWGEKDYNDYITPDRLEVAQDNTWDKNNVDEGFIGINGMYGNKSGNAVYGTQGLDKEMPGIPSSGVDTLAEF